MNEYMRMQQHLTHPHKQVVCRLTGCAIRAFWRRPRCIHRIGIKHLPVGQGWGGKEHIYIVLSLKTGKHGCTSRVMCTSPRPHHAGCRLHSHCKRSTPQQVVAAGSRRDALQALERIEYIPRPSGLMKCKARTYTVTGGRLHGLEALRW